MKTTEIGYIYILPYKKIYMQHSFDENGSSVEQIYSLLYPYLTISPRFRSTSFFKGILGIQGWE